MKSKHFFNLEPAVVMSSKAYQYDANGNLTNDGRMAYFWNDENRLVAVHSAKTGAMMQENRYDGLGRRREKIEHGADGITTNRYLYQNWLVLAVTDGGGNVQEAYTLGADMSGGISGSAGGIGGILASTKDGNSVFNHFDYNGNIVQVSSNDQIQLAKYTYSPFGEVLLKEGAFVSRFQFSSKEHETSTGLTYFGYRFYSPALGRWINRDPLKERGGLNLHAFINNRSINYVDALGASTFRQWTARVLLELWLMIAGSPPSPPDPPENPPDPEPPVSVVITNSATGSACLEEEPSVSTSFSWSSACATAAVTVGGVVYVYVMYCTPAGRVIQAASYAISVELNMGDCCTVY